MTDRELLHKALNVLEAWDARGRLRIIESIKARLAQPEPEPVAVFRREILGRGQIFWLRSSDELPNKTPLYTAPPKKEWVGLTGDAIEYIVDAYWDDPPMFIEAIESKLKKENDL